MHFELPVPDFVQFFAMTVLLYLSQQSVWGLVAGYLVLLGVLAFWIWKLDRAFKLLPLHDQERFDCQKKFLGRFQPLIRQALGLLLSVLGLSFVMAPRKMADAVERIKAHGAYHQVLLMVAFGFLALYVALPGFWHLRKAFDKEIAACLRKRHVIAAALHLLILLILGMILLLAG